MSDSLRPHEQQHARPCCPSPTPGVHPNSCPLSQMPSNHLILCRPLLLLPSIFPNTRVFSNESVLRIRWPKYWSFRFSFSPSNEYSGLISFRMDWLDILAHQGTFSTTVHSISSSALSFPYGPTLTSLHDYWKNHSFDYVVKVMSLLFSMLSRFVIVFLPRSKYLLIHGYNHHLQ